MSHGPHQLPRLALVVLLALIAACSSDTPVAPTSSNEVVTELSASRLSQRQKIKRTTQILRRVTAKYHDVNAAIDDGFVFLHDCEVRSEGAVGTIYVHPARVGDGRMLIEVPDALIYEPAADASGKLTLVGVEFAIPIAMWPHSEPPTFLGFEFEAEDEFGVYGLHAWVWRENPDGVFAEANPRVSCS